MASRTAATRGTSCVRKTARAAETGQHGEEALGDAELVLEQVERVRHRVADRQAERAQPERVQQHPGLVRDPGSGR